MLHDLFHTVFPNVTDAQLVHESVRIRQQIVTARVRQVLLGKNDNWLEVFAINERIAVLEAKLNEILFLLAAATSPDEKTERRSLKQKEDVSYGPLYLRRPKRSFGVENEPPQIAPSAELCFSQYPVSIPVFTGYPLFRNCIYADYLQHPTHRSCHHLDVSSMAGSSQHYRDQLKQTVGTSSSKPNLILQLPELSIDVELDLQLGMQCSSSGPTSGIGSNDSVCDMSKKHESPSLVKTEETPACA